MMKAFEFSDSRVATFAQRKLAMAPSENATGSLPKYIKWVLMNKVFDPTADKIARRDGTVNASVASKIQVALDQLVWGEYVLLEPAADPIGAAAVRIAQKRAGERGLAD